MTRRERLEAIDARMTDQVKRLKRRLKATKDKVEKRRLEVRYELTEGRWQTLGLALMRAQVCQ